MVFNSYTFIAFFVLILILHNLPFPWKVKKINLLLASYIFYAAWNPPFIILLWISTLIDYVVDARNRRIGRKENGAWAQKLLWQGQLSPIAELDAEPNHRGGRGL